MADKVEGLRLKNKQEGVRLGVELQQVIQLIRDGVFGDCGIFNPLLDTLTIAGDYYLVSADFKSYLECMERVRVQYKDQTTWTRKSILNCSRVGYFSADRSIREYAKDIWNVETTTVPEDWEMSNSVMRSFHDK